MTHLDEGTIQGFLDNELPPRERSAAAEHLMACADCRSAHDQLSGSKSLFSSAVAELDAPARPTPDWDGVVSAPRRASRAAPFVRAAVLVLLVAAAATAAVPGSPVRQWIVAAVQDDTRDPTDAPADLRPVDAAPGSSAPAAFPAGVSLLPGSGRLDVAVTGVEDAAIRLITSEGESVAVSATGATRDPAFRTGADGIEVRDGVGGEILVEVPSSAAAVRLLVEGRVYAECANGELDVRVPGEPVDGGVVWR